VPKGKEVLVICESGGSLENKSGTQFGFQSRSLKAAFYLQRLGYKVAHVRGGVGQWEREGLPLVADAGDGGDE
jgi:rhodanese-related sulfurtransferase